MSFLDWFRIGQSEVDEYKIKNISLSHIVTNPYQPRSFIDEDSLEELANSIEQYGVITPIIVTPTDNGQYQLVAGERRVKASQSIGKTHIPAVVRDYTEEELIEVSFLENLQRESMTEIDKAEMYERLRSEFKNLSIEELSNLIGKPAEEIKKRQWMLDLPIITRRALANDVLNERTARMLAEVDEEHHREVILFIAHEDPSPTEIVDKIQEFNPDVSPRKTEIFNRPVEISEDIIQLIEQFGEELEEVYQNGSNGTQKPGTESNESEENSENNTDQANHESAEKQPDEAQEIPEELQERN